MTQGRDPFRRPLASLPRDSIMRRPVSFPLPKVAFESSYAGRFPCPMCKYKFDCQLLDIREGLADSPIGNPSYVLPDPLFKMSSRLSRGVKDRLDAHCKEMGHAPFHVMAGRYELHSTGETMELKRYLQTLLLDGIEMFSIPIAVMQDEDLLRITFAKIFAYAIGKAREGALLSPYRGDKTTFKYTAERYLEVIMNALLAFNHSDWRLGPPNRIKMTNELFYQTNDLLLRRGLYWDPPHPALNGIVIPDITLDKDPKRKAWEEKRNAMLKKIRKQAKETNNGDKPKCRTSTWTLNEEVNEKCVKSLAARSF